MSALRVAFCGASGTGKTALARFVEERYGVPFNPVGARSVAAEMGFANPYDVDRAGRRNEFQKRLFEAKCEWEAGRESFVVDRTPLDNLAYTAMHGGCAEMTEADVLAYYRATARYTHVWFCPRGVFQSLGDLVRVQAVGYHTVFEAILRGFLMAAVVPVRNITDEGLPARIAEVALRLGDARETKE